MQSLMKLTSASRPRGFSALPRRGPPRTILAQPADPADRAVRGRRRQRHRRAADPAFARARARPADHCREQARRQRRARHRHGGEVAARRSHRRRGAGEPLGQPGGQSEDALRHREGSRAGDPDRQEPADVRAQRKGAGENGRGVHRAAQGQPGQVQLFDAGRGQPGASGDLAMDPISPASRSSTCPTRAARRRSCRPSRATPSFR